LPEVPDGQYTPADNQSLVLISQNLEMTIKHNPIVSNLWNRGHIHLYKEYSSSIQCKKMQKIKDQDESGPLTNHKKIQEYVGNSYNFPELRPVLLSLNSTLLNDLQFITNDLKEYTFDIQNTVCTTGKIWQWHMDKE
jgi:hypothetical protein